MATKKMRCSGSTTSERERYSSDCIRELGLFFIPKIASIRLPSKSEGREAPWPIHALHNRLRSEREASSRMRRTSR